MTHAAMSPEALKKAGIGANLLRLSVGIEDVNDLISDIDNALQKSQQDSLAGAQVKNLAAGSQPISYESSADSKALGEACL